MYQVHFLRWLVSISIFVTLFGACVVYLILIGQNLVSIFSAFGVTSVSFCIWLIIIAAVLTPFTWFGTPKDFWYNVVCYSSDTKLGAGGVIFIYLKNTKKQTTFLV